MSERKIVQCRSSFAMATPNGGPLMVAVGDLYYSDDSVVRGRENLFGDVQVKSSRPAATRAQETATAGPGERRSMTRPVAKAPAKKSEEDKPDA